MKRLTNIIVKFISLVRKGANQKEVIWKSDTKEENKEAITREVSIVKSDDKHMVYGVVYSPDEVDSQGDFAKAEDIEQAAIDFMKNLRQTNVDKEHSFQSEKATVVESWIVKAEGGDPFIPGSKKGSWCVGIHIDDEALWDEVKKGELTGLSMAGFASRESVNKSVSDEAVGILRKAKAVLEKVLKIKGDGDQDDKIKTEMQATAALVEKIEKKLSGKETGADPEMKTLMKEVSETMEKFEKSSLYGKRSSSVEEGAGKEEKAKEYGIILKSEAEVIVPFRKDGPITPQSQRIGGVLRPQASAKFIDFIVTSDMFSDVSIIRTDKLIRDIDVFSIMRRVLTRVAQGTPPDAFVSTSNVGNQLIMKEIDLFGQILFDTLWDNKDNPSFENEKAIEFLTSFSEDLKLLAWEGVRDDYADKLFINLNKGWPQVAKDEGVVPLNIAESYTSGGGTVNWIELMKDMLGRMPNHFKSSLLKYWMSQSDYEEFAFQFGGLASGTSADIKAGTVESFMGYGIKHKQYIPAGTLMFTPSPNLVFGINTDIQRWRDEEGKTRSIDYTFVANTDYRIARSEAIVLAQ